MTERTSMSPKKSGQILVRGFLLMKSGPFLYGVPTLDGLLTFGMDYVQKMTLYLPNF